MVVLVPITTMLAVWMRACWCTVVRTVLHLQVRGPTFNMGSVSEKYSILCQPCFTFPSTVWQSPTIFGMAMQSMQMLPGTSTSCPFRNKCPILQLHSMQIPMKCSFKSVSHGDFSASSAPRGTVFFFGLVLFNCHFGALKIPHFLINPWLSSCWWKISPFPTDNHFMNFMVNVPPNFVPVKSRVLNFHVSRWKLPCGRCLFPYF